MTPDKDILTKEIESWAGLWYNTDFRTIGAVFNHQFG